MLTRRLHNFHSGRVTHRELYCKDLFGPKGENIDLKQHSVGVSYSVPKLHTDSLISLVTDSLINYTELGTFGIFSCFQ